MGLISVVPQPGPTFSSFCAVIAQVDTERIKRQRSSSDVAALRVISPCLCALQHRDRPRRAALSKGGHDENDNPND